MTITAKITTTNNTTNTNTTAYVSCLSSGIEVLLHYYNCYN